MLVQVLLRIIIHNIGVQGQHGDVALMGFVQLAEMRKLLHAGTAVGSPEVDEHRLTAVVGKMELASVQTGDCKVLELLPDLAADRRCACEVSRSSFLPGCFRIRDNRLIAGSFRLLDVGVKEIIIEQRCAQDSQSNPPGNLLDLFALCLGVGLVVRTAAGGCFEGKAAGFEADCLLIAHIHAFGTVDALVVTHMPHIHAAAAHAGAAVVTAGGIHLHAHNRDLAEEAIDCAQRTHKTAEAAVAENAGKANDEHNDKLTRKQDVQHAEIVGIGRIRKQENRTFKGACRADVLAEARNRHTMNNPVPGGDADDKDTEDHIFQIRQRSRCAAFFDLRRGQLVQQFLDQPQRAEPAADRAAEDQPIEHEDAEDIETDLFVRCADRVLQRAQWAGADSAGAGVAVKARHTDALGGRGFALVDFALKEALDVSIIQQRTIELHEPSLGRAVGSPPGCFIIIQGQHTPYKF